MPMRSGHYNEEEWRQVLLGKGGFLNFSNRVFRSLPSDPRCKLCQAPYGGIVGPIMTMLGFGKYPGNPQLCNACFRSSAKHPGGAEIELTVLFAESTPAPPTVCEPSVMAVAVQPNDPEAYGNLALVLVHTGSRILARIDHDALVPRTGRDDIAIGPPGSSREAGNEHRASVLGAFGWGRVQPTEPCSDHDYDGRP